MNKKEQQRKWRTANPEKCAGYQRKWRAANSVTVRAGKAAYRVANQEKCRAYAAAYCAANPGKQREYYRKWRAAHPGKQSKWRVANPEKCVESARKWSAANPEKRRAMGAKRRAIKLQAIPAWADADLMHDMYAEAAYQGMELDHTVPLNSLKVCGLHWEGNFQLLTVQENASKGNRHWPDMWPRIDTPLHV